MTAALDLLARCRTLGIDLSAGPDGTLAWAADADPPAELLAALRERKAEVLGLLDTYICGPCTPAQPLAEGEPVWVLPPGTSSPPIDGSCPGCAYCRPPDREA